MKELSIEEKAHRYDEAIEMAKEYFDSPRTCIDINVLPKLFPELKESEDERIKRKIKEVIDACLNIRPQIIEEVDYLQIKKWLEKQGEQKDILENTILDSNEDGLIAETIRAKQGEQKPADKVEPKFKNGQWIVWQDKCYKVNYNDCGYELVDQNGLSTSLEYGTIDENAHIWDITKDAKAGDVLLSPGTPEGDKECPFIFKEIEDGIVRFHVALLRSEKLKIADGITNVIGYANAGYHIPATKEQRDTLMKAMADAGLEFDFDKKELKKIEQKPTWSEEDERMYRGLHNLIYSTPHCDSRKELSDWLKSLKDRVQPQPKQEWSEEDEKCIRLSTDIIDSALRAGFCVQLDRDRCVDWLKSLRPQNKWKKSLKTADLENNLWWIQGSFSDTSREYRILGEAIEYIRCTEPSWRPSDEQMYNLSEAAHYNCAFFDMEILKGLYDDLKKLMG